MFSLAIFGGNRIDSTMLDPGERVVLLSLFGGFDIDFATSPPPPAVDLIVISIFGGAKLTVRPDQPVRCSGFSIFGGRSIEPLRRLPPPRTAQRPDADDEGPLPLEVTAYSAFGGLSVKRASDQLVAGEASVTE